ncbi:GAF domain-containing protein [Haloimpatiens sp. FM7330]|uniref:GAF domain-containing protein n=1 Tax=Haloimpatiens sp. FM7330 TaxID=3298610 RepID=UPI003644BBFB
MFDIKIFEEMDLNEKYENMVSMLEALISDETDFITNLSNASALINALVGRVNWCGFYLMKNGELVLGPFQGMPACTRIQVGKGVCGTAVEDKKTLIVEDVHKFEGHIACDSASNSEIVVPIIKDDIVYGVLDIDSMEFGRFTSLEKEYLEKCVYVLNKYIDWINI